MPVCIIPGLSAKGKSLGEEYMTNLTYMAHIAGKSAWRYIRTDFLFLTH